MILPCKHPGGWPTSRRRPVYLQPNGVPHSSRSLREVGSFPPPQVGPTCKLPCREDGRPPAPKPSQRTSTPITTLHSPAPGSWPMPPLRHSVARPRRAFRRSISCRSVTMSRVPPGHRQALALKLDPQTPRTTLAIRPSPPLLPYSPYALREEAWTTTCYRCCWASSRA